MEMVFAIEDSAQKDQKLMDAVNRSLLYDTPSLNIQWVRMNYNELMEKGSKTLQRTLKKYNIQNVIEAIEKDWNEIEAELAQCAESNPHCIRYGCAKLWYSYLPEGVLMVKTQDGWKYSHFRDLRRVARRQEFNSDEEEEDFYKLLRCIDRNEGAVKDRIVNNMDYKY
jgi:hypothetical protein